MQEFNSKKEAFEYIKKKFLTFGVKGIVIHGSTGKGRIKNFSDIDAVVFNDKKIKPYYELFLVKDKLVLLSVYFYRPGEEMPLPKKGFAIYGKYYSQIEHPKNLIYTKKERIRRDNQMFIDMLFKYVRCKDKKYIKIIDKYTRI